MNKVLGRKPLYLLSTVLAVLLCTLLLSYFTEGMPLFGIPSTDLITKVTVEHVGLGGEVREFTDEENIALAHGLAGWLNYSLGRGDTTKEPTIVLTYQTDAGNSTVVLANDSTLWWKGKAYPLKKPGAFVKLTEGCFFPNVHQ